MLKHFARQRGTVRLQFKLLIYLINTFIHIFFTLWNSRFCETFQFSQKFINCLHILIPPLSLSLSLSLLQLLTTLNEDGRHFDGDAANSNNFNKQSASGSSNSNDLLNITTNLYDNKQIQQLRSSSPNSSISKGRTELLLGDQSLRQEIR